MINMNLKYFYSTIKDGNMNTDPKFYKEGMTKEEIRGDFTKRRIKLGEQDGFDGLRIITPIQKSKPSLEGKTREEKRILLDKYNSKYPDGYYVRITEEMIEGYKDLYNLDIYADILMIGSELPKIALAYPTADCPVVFVEDTKNEVVAMAHCGGEYIDRKLPSQMIDAIREETDAKTEDLNVFVGPYAHKENFTYDRIPSWAQDFSVWSRALENKCGYIHVDMELAIRRQLLEQGIDSSNIQFSCLDTITNPELYSNNQARFHIEKAGRFYSGCFYEKSKDLQKSKSITL